MSKGGRTRSSNLELKKGKFFCLAVKKVSPNLGGKGESPQGGALAPTTAQRWDVNGGGEGKDL